MSFVHRIIRRLNRAWRAPAQYPSCTADECYFAAVRNVARRQLLSLTA